MSVIRLGDFGEIPLVTVGDSVFPQYEWLLKTYNVNTRDEQQKYFNKRLCGARVITENAYGMLTGRWRFLYKKKHNVDFRTYVTSSWHVLHCITFVLAGPILANLMMTRSWAVGINRKAPFRRADKEASNLIRMKTNNWLRMDH